MTSWCVPMGDLSDSGDDCSDTWSDTSSDYSVIIAAFDDNEDDNQSEADTLYDPDLDVASLELSESDESQGLITPLATSENDLAAIAGEHDHNAASEIYTSPASCALKEKEPFPITYGPVHDTNLGSQITLESADGSFFSVDEEQFSRVFWACPNLQNHLRRWSTTQPAALPFTARLMPVIVAMINATDPRDFPAWFKALSPTLLLARLMVDLMGQSASEFVDRAMHCWRASNPFTAFALSCALGWWRRDLVFSAIRNMGNDPIIRDPSHNWWDFLKGLQAPKGEVEHSRNLADKIMAGLCRLSTAMLRNSPFPVPTGSDFEDKEQLYEFWDDVADNFVNLWQQPPSVEELEDARRAELAARFFNADEDD